MKKFISMFAVVLLIFTAICPTNTVYAATKPKLNKTKLELSVGDDYTLKLKNDTLSKSAVEMTWTSSNQNVAIVSSDGTVVATGEGKAKVKLKVGDKKYTCNVTVSGFNLNSMLYKISSLVIYDLWNDDLCSIYDYIHLGKQDISDILADFSDTMVQMEEYNNYINGLAGEKYDDLKETWNNLYSESQSLYQTVLNNPPIALDESYVFNTENFTEYSNAFLEECSFLK